MRDEDFITFDLLVHDLPIVNAVALKVHIVFLRDVTLAVIANGDVLRPKRGLRQIHAGKAILHPGEEYSPWRGMKEAFWKCCWNIDGLLVFRDNSLKWLPHGGLSLGPVGARIYKEFRIWLSTGEESYTDPVAYVSLSGGLIPF